MSQKVTNIKDKQRILDPGALEWKKKTRIKEKTWVSTKNHSSRTFPELKKKKIWSYIEKVHHISENTDPKWSRVLKFEDKRKDLLDV